MIRKLRTIEMHRLSVEEFKESDKLPLTVVLDDVRSMYNIGSVFRTADAFRVKEICLCGITARPPHPEIHKTALGAEDSVAWRYFESADECVDTLRREGCQVMAIEQCEGSTSIHDFHPFSMEKNGEDMENDGPYMEKDTSYTEKYMPYTEKKEEKTAFSTDNGEENGFFSSSNGKEKAIAVVLGNEVKGVRQSVIDRCDGCIEIPQYGTKHSMNVSVTAGIIIYHIATAYESRFIHTKTIHQH